MYDRNETSMSLIFMYYIIYEPWRPTGTQCVTYHNILFVIFPWRGPSRTTDAYFTLQTHPRRPVIIIVILAVLFTVHVYEVTNASNENAQ